MSNIGNVYAMAVAEGIQPGDIGVVGKAMLIRHNCGFAQIMSRCDDKSLEEIFALMETEHFRLFSDDKDTIDFLREKGAECEQRFFYEYPQSSAPDIPLPEGFCAAEMDSDNISALQGHIVPSKFWGDDDTFFRHGKGYVITKDGIPVSWAFTAAVSSTEADIGTETLPEYRGMGLSAAAVARLTEYILSSGKAPVYACNVSNAASQRTAEKAGFSKAAECTVLFAG